MTRLEFLVHQVREHRSESCLVWPYAKDKDGYGCTGIGIGNQMRKVHRVAFEMTYGAIPAGKVVMHICDNPGCFNPRHLKAGSSLENSMDRDQKMRTAGGARNGNAKLSEAQVLAIFRSGQPRRELAQQFGIARATVDHIKVGRYWSKLTGSATQTA